MTQADAAAIVLSDAGRPMHRREIAEAILRRGFDVWGGGGPGRTPWESVGRAITQEMVHRGSDARFEYEKRGSGVYRLRRRLTPSQRPKPSGGMLAELLEEVRAEGYEDPSSFVCIVTRGALQRGKIAAKEAAHERGYRLHPVKPGEFDGGETSDVWDEL